MKQLLTLLTGLLLLLSLSCNKKAVLTASNTRANTVSTTSLPTTLFIVRHAEKQAGKNPSLTDTGKRRATELARVLEKVPLDAIYSSNYKRTKETALPTANRKNLTITDYNPRELQELATNLLATQTGKTILLIGHSNTNPELLNIFTKTNDYPPMTEKQYDDIFLLRVHEIGTTEVMHLQYGTPTK